jgi:formamidopyrimidine-DNA glycosylase
MPELPEVETTVRALRPNIVGQTIIDFYTNCPSHIKHSDIKTFRKQIKGSTIQSINRRGKYLVMALNDSLTLIIHLRMSGHLSVVNHSEPIHKHDRTFFYLQNGKDLRFRDQRKFGTVDLVHHTEEVLGRLGPEPLQNSFTSTVLWRQLKGRRRAIKPLLLDQHVIAGIGNIYADEALFYANIHPTRAADSLTVKEIEALHSAIQKVLTLGIEREGASIDTYIKPDSTRGEMQNALAVFRRNGEPCYVCHSDIQRIVLGGRSTHFCPHCQK